MKTRATTEVLKPGTDSRIYSGEAIVSLSLSGGKETGHRFEQFLVRVTAHSLAEALKAGQDFADGMVAASEWADHAFLGGISFSTTLDQLAKCSRVEGRDNLRVAS